MVGLILVLQLVLLQLHFISLQLLLTHHKTVFILKKVILPSNQHKMIPLLSIYFILFLLRIFELLLFLRIFDPGAVMVHDFFVVDLPLLQHLDHSVLNLSRKNSLSIANRAVDFLKVWLGY